MLTSRARNVTAAFWLVLLASSAAAQPGAAYPPTSCGPGQVCRPAALAPKCVATASLPTCAAASAGAVRCSATLNAWVYCDGTSWSAVATAATTGWTYDPTTPPGGGRTLSTTAYVRVADLYATGTIYDWDPVVRPLTLLGTHAPSANDGGSIVVVGANNAITSVNQCIIEVVTNEAISRDRLACITGDGVLTVDGAGAFGPAGLSTDGGAAVGSLRIGPLAAPDGTGLAAGSYWRLGSFSASAAGMWGTAAPSATNYTLASDATDAYLNAPTTTVHLRTAGTSRLSCTSATCSTAAGVTQEVISGATVAGAGAQYSLKGRLSAATTAANVSNVVVWTDTSLDTNDLIFAVTQAPGASVEVFSVDQEGDIGILGSLGFGTAGAVVKALIATAPTAPVACTSPSITHGTAISFQADVGTGCAVATFAFTLPTATNGWFCAGRNKTAGITRQLVQSAESTTSATMTNVDWAGTATNFADGDDLVIGCTAR